MGRDECSLKGQFKKREVGNFLVGKFEVNKFPFKLENLIEVRKFSMQY